MLIFTQKPLQKTVKNIWYLINKNKKNTFEHSGSDLLAPLPRVFKILAAFCHIRVERFRA